MKVVAQGREIPSCGYYTVELTLLFSMQRRTLEGVDCLSNRILEWLWVGSVGTFRTISILQVLVRIVFTQGLGNVA